MLQLITYVSYVYRQLKRVTFGILSFIHPGLHGAIVRYKMYVKYILAGGTAAVTDIALLVFFSEVLSLHYLPAATLAFAVAFLVSFVLQKFWTFSDTEFHRIHAQLMQYLGIALTNLLINAGFMYLFVDLFGIFYVFAQIMAGGLIALTSFFVYRKFVFVNNG